MQATNPFAHGRRLDDPTRASLTDSIRGRGAHPFSRRDLLRAGAAGLVGLGLPLVAPPRARAGCPVPTGPGTGFPSGFPVLVTGGATKNGVTGSDPFLENGQLCAWVTNNTTTDMVVVWDIFDAPNANTFQCVNGNAGGDFGVDQLLMSISSPCTVRAGQTIKCCTSVPSTCVQGDLFLKQADLGAFQADLVSLNPAVIATPTLISSPNIISAILIGGDCGACCIRMTGGGGTVPTSAGGVVETSQGFQLRTGYGAHSNIEVHWTVGGTLFSFHSGPPDGLSNLRCGFDTSCSGGQPLSQPNLIFGLLNGTLNGQPATMFINFVDCGEPGTNDTRQIAIFDGNGNSVVLAKGVISNGNNQAHKCTGNDN